MMKRLLVIVMLLSLATAASAALDTAWQVQLRATDLSNMNAGAIGSYGVGAASTANGTEAVGIVWNGIKATSPPRIKDVRVALPEVTEMVWEITITAGSSYAATKFRLHAWNPTATAGNIDAGTGSTYKLYKGAVVEYEFLAAANGTSLLPQFTKEYDILAGGKVDFLLKRTLLPEPGSMLALMSGLVGLAGFAIRRKR